jgi:hypothetical protein
MSLRSAREKVPHTDMEPGYCFPMALDSILPSGIDLSQEFYDLSRHAQSYNQVVTYLLDEFFRVKPQPDTDLAAIAKFNAYGSSPQSYMPDIPIAAYRARLRTELKLGVSHKQVRLQEVLAEASRLGCNVLFSNPISGPYEHVSGLQVVDPGRGKYDTEYLIRDFSAIDTQYVYSSADFVGMTPAADDENLYYAPLPEVTRQAFPDGQSSWELIILPPAPEPRTLITVAK